MRFSKILSVCVAGMFVVGLSLNVGANAIAAENLFQNGTVLADGGAPLPPPVFVADGGAPLPPPVLMADGGAPLPPPVLVADGGAPLPPPSIQIATAA